MRYFLSPFVLTPLTSISFVQISFTYGFLFFSKAMSVVLHEYDTNAVIGIEAKKLCCNLVWDVKDREMPAANGGVSQSAAVAVVSVMVASLLAAVLL